MMEADLMSDYQIPKVWEWKEENPDLSGNRPTAGPRFDQDLPVGDAPLQVYSLGTPNGKKITIILEELKELGKDIDYDLYKIDITKGDQFGSDFVKLNPNSKIPAMVDQSLDPSLKLFESGSILQYLANKYGHFLPEEIHEKTETLNWLYWQIGAAPYVGGGFGHFFAHISEAMEYPIDRFTKETKRQLDLLDKVLADRPYIAGDQYTIADIAIWPWYGELVLGNLYKRSDEFLNVTEYTNLRKWAQNIADRPGVKKGLAADYQSIN